MLPNFIKVSTQYYPHLWIRIDQIQAISDTKIWMVDGTYYDDLLTSLEEIDETFYKLALMGNKND